MKNIIHYKIRFSAYSIDMDNDFEEEILSLNLRANLSVLIQDIIQICEFTRYRHDTHSIKLSLEIEKIIHPYSDDKQITKTLLSKTYHAHDVSNLLLDFINFCKFYKNKGI